MASGAKLTTSDSQLKLGVGVVQAKTDTTSVVPQASVEYRKLNLGISVVDAATDITYVLPAANVSYVALSLSAILDNENRNPFVIESAVVLDQASINLGKRFSEQSTISDILATIAVGKAFQEAVTTSELFSLSLGFIREYEDTISNITDSPKIGFSSKLADSVSVTDNLRFNIGLAKNDIEIIIDDADITHGPDWIFGKSTVEVIGAVDQPTNTFGKALAETFSSSDLAALGLEKAVADIVSGVVDSAPIIDMSVVYTDSIAAAEAAFLQYGTTYSDTFSASDSTITSTNKVLDDSISGMTDTGSLRMTDYCDITYFAEAYVGIYQTF